MLTLTDEVDDNPALWDGSHGIGPPFVATPWLDNNWRSCVVAPGAMTIYQYDGPLDTIVEEVCGVYFLWNATGGLLYVGLTKDAEYRLSVHWKQRRIPFVAYSFIELREPLIRPVEAAYIEALDPPYNAKPEYSYWDGHEAMARRIARVWRLAERRL